MGLEGEESNWTTQNSEYQRHCADFASGSNFPCVTGCVTLRKLLNPSISSSARWEIWAGLFWGYFPKLFNTLGTWRLKSTDLKQSFQSNDEPSFCFCHWGAYWKCAFQSPSQIYEVRILRLKSKNLPFQQTPQVNWVYSNVWRSFLVTCTLSSVRCNELVLSQAETSWNHFVFAVELTRSASDGYFILGFLALYLPFGSPRLGGSLARSRCRV